MGKHLCCFDKYNVIRTVDREAQVNFSFYQRRGPDQQLWLLAMTFRPRFNNQMLSKSLQERECSDGPAMLRAEIERDYESTDEIDRSGGNDPRSVIHDQCFMIIRF